MRLLVEVKIERKLLMGLIEKNERNCENCDNHIFPIATKDVETLLPFSISQPKSWATNTHNNPFRISTKF